MPTPSPARLHDFTVVSNEKIADGVLSLVISAPRLAGSLKPGQFVNLAVPGNAMSLLRIPLSFASADADKGTVEIWYAVVGEGTERLSQMQPGSTSTLLGPGGHGWTVPEGCKKALLVGGGIGVPPVLCLARDLASSGIAFDVCVGAASADTWLVLRNSMPPPRERFSSLPMTAPPATMGSARIPPLSFWRLAAMTTLPRAVPAP